MSDANSVPLGRANTGAAVVFDGGLGALRYLQQTDALNARLQARREADAARLRAAQEKDMLNRVRLNDGGGVTYVPQLQQKAQDLYQNKLTAIAKDPSLDWGQKSMRIQQEVDQYNREAKVSESIDKTLLDLGQRITADKRYNRDKTIGLIAKTQYRDGEATPINPLEYNTQAAVEAVGRGREQLNGVEIMRQYAAAERPDAITYNVEALPGGRGTRRTATSDFYELTPEGKILRDTKTNLPVVKASPEALARFESDPVNRQYLDSFEEEHQAQLAGAVEKMQRFEALTPEESEAVAREQSPAGRRLDLFKNLLTTQAYGRESTTLTNRPAPRPRSSGGSGGKPRFTVSGGESYAPGVLGGTGVQGTRGIAHFGTSEPLRRITSSGDVKPYSANATHNTYVMLSPEGRAEMVTTNAAPQQLDYDAPVVLLRRPNGAVYFPSDPKIAEAARNGDTGPLLEWARAEKAKNPSLRAEPFMLAAQSKRADLDISSPEAAFQQLKAERERYQKLAAGGADSLQGAISQEGGSDEEKQALTTMLSALNQGKAVRLDTDAELLAKARKLVQQQNMTLAIPYQGQEKIRIDANTGYVMRADNGRRAKALQAQVDRINNDLKNVTPTTAGRGPLAGQVPAAMGRAAGGAAGKQAAPVVNKFGFKFGTK